MSFRNIYMPIRVAIMALATSFLVSTRPALARPQFYSDGQLNWDALIDDPLGLGIGAALLAFILIGSFIALRGAPTAESIENKRTAFLERLPSDSKGNKAVLYVDEVQGMQSGAQIFNHRVTVELVHEDPAKSETLYRKRELPSVHKTMDRIASTEAANIWLDAALEKGLPAVCATRKGIQKLTGEHLDTIKTDRAGFIERLHGRMWANAKKPAG